MSIPSAIQTKQQQIAASYTACNSKGATMPAAGSQTLTNLASTINTIETKIPTNQKIQKWICTPTQTGSTVLSTLNNSNATSNDFSYEQVGPDATNTLLTLVDTDATVYDVSIEVTGISNATYGDIKYTVEYTNNGTTFYPISDGTGLIYGGAKTSYTGSNLTYKGIQILGYYNNSKYRGLQVDQTDFLNGATISITAKSITYEDVYTREKEYVGANYTTVPANKFDGNTSLVSVLLPQTVTTIRQYAFRGCTKLKYINLENLQYLIITCFQGCSSLSSVTIKDIRSLENNVFQNCTNLTKVNLISTVSLGIGNSVFQGCSSLKTVAIPTTTTSIGNYCFYNCTNLEELNLPQTITYLGATCFRYCRKLNIVLDLPNLTGFDTAGQDSGITGVENLGRITNCGSNYALGGCTSLTYAKLPATFTSMGNWLFGGDTALTTVYIYATTPPSYGTAPFQGCSSLAHIYVPSANVADYQAATGWSAHASIISAIPT